MDTEQFYKLIIDRLESDRGRAGCNAVLTIRLQCKARQMLEECQAGEPTVRAPAEPTEDQLWAV